MDNRIGQPDVATGTSLTVLPVGASLAPPSCLKHCLAGEASNLQRGGCQWLRATAQGHPDPGLLNAGKCDQGLPVAAQVTRMHNQQVVLISIVDHENAPPAPMEIGRLKAENEALADEVLRNYEQLSLIFNLTQRITQVTDVEQIERLLLERIGKLLRTAQLCLIAPDEDPVLFDVHTGIRTPAEGPCSPEESDWIQQVRRTSGVQVRNTEDGQLMVGVLQRLDDRRDLVLIRRTDGTEFSAGDIQILEALLTFGGQILSNNELHLRLRQMSIEATRALVSAIDKKDHYTFGHSERVGFLARLTGMELGLSDGDLELLEWAGLLHDVGKIGVPEEILSKPGRLTDEEFEIVKKHPEMGYEILKPIRDFHPILEGVLYHHENPDGSGYPRGLVGDEIPLFAGVLHVVDVFDALTSRRSYRDAFSTEKALNILRNEAGTKLNAEFVAAFLQALERFRREHRELFLEMFPIARQELEQST